VYVCASGCGFEGPFCNSEIADLDHESLLQTRALISVSRVITSLLLDTNEGLASPIMCALEHLVTQSVCGMYSNNLENGPQDQFPRLFKEIGRVPRRYVPKVNHLNFSTDFNVSALYILCSVASIITAVQILKTKAVTAQDF
jgi:hypothetical protein